MFECDRATLKNTCGVYAIVNKVTGRRYIGGTRSNFFERSKAHWHSLQSGKHRTKELQQDWLILGPDNFEFVVVESYPKDTNRFWVRHREAVHIVETPNIYNMQFPSMDSLDGRLARQCAPRRWTSFYGVSS